MTPRLKVTEPRQGGRRQGGPTPAKKPKRKHVRAAASPPARADRASRAKAAAQTPSGRKRPALLSPSAKASVATKHMKNQQLPKKERAQAHKSLIEEFGVSRTYPAKITQKMLGRKKLPMRQGKGAAHKKTMTPQKIEEVKQILKEHAFDITFEQIGEEVGVSASILCRFFKSQAGWRQAGKSTRPLLEERHVEARAAWAKSNLANH